MHVLSLSVLLGDRATVVAVEQQNFGFDSAAWSTSGSREINLLQLGFDLRRQYLCTHLR